MSIDELIINLQERREAFGGNMEVVVNHLTLLYEIHAERSFPDHANEDPLVLYTRPF